MLTYLKHMALAAAAALCAAPDQPQEWELINPTGEIEKVAVEPAKRITALEGKTIALRWNGKNNGDLVLDRLAELLAKKYPTAKVVKTYRDMADQNLNKISATQDESMRIVKAVASVRPDIVIASQAD
jgi:ABC-type Fe3+-hydroxamate transport system substrate-binding protein